jgi:3-oxoacyl-[acyl-carrier protein] reductase
MKPLAGKVAIVTGSSKGIGAGIAKHLAADGASVVVNYACSRSEAEEVVDEILAAGGSAIPVQANVADKRDVERLFRISREVYGPLDILVNNAGLYIAAPLGEITAEHFHLHYNLNVLGLILTTQEALNHFGPNGGSVINISSVLSTLSTPGTAVYNSTKSAVDGLTRTFAKELAPRGIRVNSVNPGLVETEGLYETGLIETSGPVVAATPMGRIGQPEDIAPAVAFLAAAGSGWMTGECVYMTGGLR